MLALVLPIVLLLTWRFLKFPKAISVSFRARHVFITGGSSGIGLAIAQLAVVEGSRITIVGRDVEKLNVARREIIAYWETKHGNVQGVPGDFAEPRVQVFSADVKVFSSIHSAMTAAVAEFGPLDVLICSHGVSIPGLFEESTLDNMMHEIDTNLKGNIHSIKAAIPLMNNRAGSDPAWIVIVNSLLGQIGLYGYAAYSASKFALSGLAQSLQQELVPKNIRLSLIFPPDTMTPGFIEENKTKPEVTKLLSGASSTHTAMEVAKKSMKGLKAGQYSIHCNFEGFLLSILSAGGSPQPSLFRAIVEVTFMGLVRLIWLFTLSGFYKTILNWQQGQAK